jgi:hypothetical protein
MSASAIIADVRSLLAGDPAFLAGSLVAEEAYGMASAHDDVDLFVPNAYALMTLGQKLQCNGFTLADRFDRVWARWMKYGMGSWHTNSLKLIHPNGVTEYNLVYKLVGKKPVTSLAEVIESFDFGLLAVGYDLANNEFRDMRSFLFPNHAPGGALPLMPNKREDWRGGFISRYNGLREAGRYAKYIGYGYDLSLVRDDLVVGYTAASDYLSTHFDKDKQLLGQIYDTIVKHIEHDMIDELNIFAKKVDFNDELDVIMEALE